MDTILDIRSTGAVAGGLCTSAIQLAVDRVSAAGGGTVLVPPGTWISGTLHLRSRIELRLQPGAVLQASTDLADFPQTGVRDGDRHGRHFIAAEGCHDLAITGGGVIDGSGPAFWHPQEGPKQWIREKDPRVSPMLELSRCHDLRLCDITIRNSPGWTVHAFCCDRMTIRGVTIANDLWGPNTDGMDLNGVRDLVVSDCRITCGDDAICLKTTRDARSCERVVVTNCIIETQCAALKCGTESWHDFRSIAMSNCVVVRSPRAVGLYAFDGGRIEDVTITGITCDTATGWVLNRPIHLDVRRRDATRPVGPDAPAVGGMRGITIANCTLRTDGRIIATAADGGWIDQLHLRGISVRYPLVEDPREIGPKAVGLQFSKHSPEARGANAVVVCERVRGLRVEGLAVAWPDPGEPLEPGWADAEDSRQWARPPFAEQARRKAAGTPPFHLVWLREVHAAHIDVAGNVPSRAGLEPVVRSG